MSDAFRTPPRDVCKTMSDWAHDFFTDPESFAEHFIEIYPEEGMRIPAPKSAVPQDWETSCGFPRACVAVMPNGRVWGDHGTVITPDNKLVADLSLELEDCGLWQQTELAPPLYLSGNVAIVSLEGHKNYFHWMFDHMTRFHLLERSGIPIDVYLIHGDLTLPFHRETLNAIGIPEEKTIPIPSGCMFHLEAERLIVPSVCGHLYYPKWCYAFIRDRFMGGKDGGAHRGGGRIYISREDAMVRKVVNERDVAELLELYGFQKVSLHALSVADQISLFHSAEAIAAPHGAGLTNLTFCAPGTKVIELFPDPPTFYGFWMISAYAELDYYCLLCDKVPPFQPHPHWDNFKVNLATLRDTLELANIELV